MTVEDWNSPHLQALGMLLSGRLLREVNARGRTPSDDTLLVVFNAGGTRRFVLPEPPQGRGWEVVLSTDPDRDRPDVLPPKSPLLLRPRQVKVLRASQPR
jgi:hypothetical protein